MKERWYEKLIVWKEAHKLCVFIYKTIEKYPSREKFNLVSQMCRSAYSIPMNIAEGNTRRTQKDKVRFIDIAIGSLEELHYQLILSRDLKYINNDVFEKFDEKISRVGYLLNQWRKSVNK